MALVDRVLKGEHKSLDEQLDRDCNLEVKQAVALYRTGKSTIQDPEKVMSPSFCFITSSRHLKFPMKQLPISTRSSKNGRKTFWCYANGMRPAKRAAGIAFGGTGVAWRY